MVNTETFSLNLVPNHKTHIDCNSKASRKYNV